MPKEAFEQLQAVTNEKAEEVSNEILGKKISAHSDKIE